MSTLARLWDRTPRWVPILLAIFIVAACEDIRHQSCVNSGGVVMTGIVWDGCKRGGK